MNRNRIAAAVVLAGAVLGTVTMGSGAAQAAAADGPAGGLVGMLGIGGGGDQTSGTVSGNSSVAEIGGQTTEQSTSGD